MNAASPAFSFCPVLGEMLSARKLTGRNGTEFNGLDALSTENNLHVLRAMMLEFKPQRTLEIGLSFGGSALVFTASHRDLGHAPAGQHVALDPFQDAWWDGCGVDAVHRAGLSAWFDFRAQSSSVELPRMFADGQRFELIYIDGSHNFDDVFVDSFYAVRLLADGGVLAFDDAPDPRVRKVLRFIQRNLSHATAEIDLGNFRPDGGRPLRYRVAKLLGRTQMRAFRRTGNPSREGEAPFTEF